MRKYKLEAKAIIEVEGQKDIKTPVTITFEAENIEEAKYEGFRLCKEATLCWSYGKPEEIGGTDIDEAEKRTLEEE